MNGRLNLDTLAVSILLALCTVWALVITFLWGEDEAANAPNILWGDMLGILAALSWALTTVVIKQSNLSTAPSMQILFYQVLVGFVLLSLLAVQTQQLDYQWTLVLGLNLVFQIVVVGLICFTAWLWLLKRYVASQLSIFTFLTPVLGVVLGIVLLQDPLQASFVVGAGMVIAGMLMVQGHGYLRRWLIKY